MSLTEIRRIQGQDFQFFELLGEGVYGKVYRAVWLTKGHLDVAIKRISKKEMCAKQMTKRVEAEISVQEHLNHKNILKLYKALQDENNYYLILELCLGGDLENFLKRQKGEKLSEPMASLITKQVIEGLGYLKTQNIIHRDLKLANVLLTKDNVVKIADFGLAAKANGSHKTLCGTPNFMSPDYLSGLPQSFEVDIWSLGCFFYTLIVGRPPFQGRDAVETMHKAASETLNIPSFVSEDAARLVRSLLQKDPQKRISLEEILYQPFFNKHSSEVRLYDSGLGSTDSGLSSISGRKSDLRIGSSSVPSLSPLSEHYPATHHSYNSDDGHYRMTRPRIGRTAESKSDGHKNLKNAVMKTIRSQVAVLPSHDFDTEYLSKGRYPAKGDSGYEQGNEHNCLQSKRSEDCHSRNHPSHGCCVEVNPSCSRCGESEQCTRHKCRENIRSCSPSRCCQSNSWEKKCCHNANSSTCSHLGTCDAVHCHHEDICRCRASPAKVPCAPQQDPVETTDNKPPKPPPFNTKRLKYERVIGRSAAMTVLEDGDVVCEILKRTDNRTKVVEVYRISGDGMNIKFYRPANNGTFSPDRDDSPVLLEGNVKKSVTYDKLPPKHWNRYRYSAKFIASYKAKTPKVTMYSLLAKCVLMESAADFTMSFYDGSQITKSPEKTEIVDVDGNKLLILADFNASNLRGNMVDLWKHFTEMEKSCRTVESSLQRCIDSSLAQDATMENVISKLFFPAYLGRRPQGGIGRSGVASTLQSVVSLANLPSYNGSKVSTFSYSGLSAVSSTLEPQKENIHPQYHPRPMALRQSNSIQPKPSAAIKNHETKITHIEENGKSVRVQFSDMTEMIIVPTETRFIDKKGSEICYVTGSVMPEAVQAKLALVRSGMERFGLRYK